MYLITADNVNAALPQGIDLLESCGASTGSRNGDAIAAPMPVVTHYRKPRERVLFYAQRDANPFFHLMESLWMLAGRNDLGWIHPFAKNIANYADGETFHGAYGYRWRNHFEMDQVKDILQLLQDYPQTRRAVLTMFDPKTDLYGTEKNTPKDIPCNTQIYFRRLGGYLQMTVTCRSNDMIWGAYGANVVHFSILQEYMAAMLGDDVGSYWQVSNNFHVYTNELWERVRPIRVVEVDPYGAAMGSSMVDCYPLADPGYEEQFFRDLMLFMEDPSSNGYANSFFHRIAKPMFWAHVAWRNRRDPERFFKARECLSRMPERIDWRVAALQWLNMREIEAQSK